MEKMIAYPNAKINIGLNIVERRNDGYHNIETVFYPIGLSDVLHVEPSESCSDYSFSASGIAIDGDPENNLIVKAYRILQNEYELPPIDISLHKQIPFGAGLGGGSADAAFMLKLLNEQFELKISTRKLRTLAAKLGADCPVFISNKPVFASGIGNVFTKISLNLIGYYLLLVKPDIHVSTPDAYANVTPSVPEKSLIELIQLPVEEWKGNVVNDFEKSVFQKFPLIATIKDQMYHSGAVYASMSGSGSAVYGIFKDEPTIEATFDDYFVAGGYL